MKERNIVKSSLGYILLVVAIVASMLFILGKEAIVKADPIDYVEGTYKGVVKTKKGDGAKMYVAPGSANKRTLDKDEKEITVADGTEVIITSEQKDPDTDMWYECIVKIGEDEYKGFLFSGRVVRDDDSFAQFTATPAPTEEVTPTPEETEPTITEDPEKLEDIFTNTDNQGTDEDTKKMVDESKTFRPFTYITAIIIVIIIFFIVYTVWVKKSEEKLEREMERYSNRPQYEPLEGELKEDYEQAKSNYYDHIGLGDQGGRTLSEVIGGTEDVELDMSGIFDDEPVNEEPKTESDSIDDIIASLENRLGGNADDDWTRKDDETEDDWAVSESVDEWSDEEPAEIFSDENEESWDESDHEIPEELQDEEYSDEEFEEETWEEPVEEVSDHTLDVEASKKAIVANQRAYLDSLPVGVALSHKVYGVGKVIDNSDDNIIQVSFGDDMRFLKKDKLVEKNLIKF